MSEYLKKSTTTAIYKSPQRGLLAHLPSSWVPYAELMRLQKPVGIMNIYFPYLFGALYAACIARPTISMSSLSATNMALFATAFVLRSVGCTWNDIIDRDLDQQVARCCLRPMARGAISLRNAYIFTAIQGFVWVGMLSQICPQYLFYTIPLLLMVAFYPFSKRLTDYAQVVLGMTLAWGVLIGCVVTGVDPLMLMTEEPVTTGAGLVCLYFSYVVWAVIHDTVYAYQDIEDDVKAGIKSMAVRYRDEIKFTLSGLGLALLGLLTCSGTSINAGPLYFSGAVVGTASLLAWMIWRVDLADPKDCWWWFQNGCLIVGGTITTGLYGEYLNRLFGLTTPNKWL